MATAAEGEAVDALTAIVVKECAEFFDARPLDEQTMHFVIMNALARALAFGLVQSYSDRAAMKLLNTLMPTILKSERGYVETTEMLGTPDLPGITELN